jgi:hypothetical protein
MRHVALVGLLPLIVILSGERLRFLLQCTVLTNARFRGVGLVVVRSTDFVLHRCGVGAARHCVDVVVSGLYILQLAGCCVVGIEYDGGDVSFGGGGEYVDSLDVAGVVVAGDEGYVLVGEGELAAFVGEKNWAAENGAGL